MREHEQQETLTRSRVSVRARKNLWERMIREKEKEKEILGARRGKNSSRIYDPVRYGTHTALHDRSTSMMHISQRMQQEKEQRSKGRNVSIASLPLSSTEQSGGRNHVPVQSARSRPKEVVWEMKQKEKSRASVQEKEGVADRSDNQKRARDEEIEQKEVTVHQEQQEEKMIGNKEQDKEHEQDKDSEKGKDKGQDKGKEQNKEKEQEKEVEEGKASKQCPEISPQETQPRKQCDNGDQRVDSKGDPVDEESQNSIALFREEPGTVSVIRHVSLEQDDNAAHTRNGHSSSMHNQVIHVDSDQESDDDKGDEEDNEIPISSTAMIVGMAAKIPSSPEQMQRQYYRSNTIPIDTMIHMMRSTDELERASKAAPAEKKRQCKGLGKGKNQTYEHVKEIDDDEDIIDVEPSKQPSLRSRYKFITTTTFSSDMPLHEITNVNDIDVSEFDRVQENSLYVQDACMMNPLYESDIITKNPLYEADLVMINPLFEESAYGAMYQSSSNIDDEESKLVFAMRKSLPTKDRVIGVKLKTKCFSGSEMVKWIQNRTNTTYLRADAVSFCQHLLKQCVIKNVKVFEMEFSDSTNSFYRFVEDYRSRRVLNSVKVFSSYSPVTPSTKKSSTSSLLSHVLHENIQEEDYEPYAPVYDIHRKLCFVLDEIISLFTYRNDSGEQNKSTERIFPKHIQLFDYTGFYKSKHYADMQYQVYRLQKCDPTVLQGEERRAFLINLYNVLMLHGLMRFGRPTNMVMRKRFLRTVKYVVGHFKISLDDISNFLLGSRTLSRSTLGTLFSDNANSCPPSSPHYRLIVPGNFDPRIHFALITGCISSPILRVYEANHLDKQLTEATSFYLQNEKLRIELDIREITISQKMNWWHEDFGLTSRKRLQWAMPFLSLDDQGKLSLLLRNAHQDYTVHWAAYNWALNHISLKDQPKLIDQLQFVTIDQSTLFGDISRRSVALHDSLALSDASNSPSSSSSKHRSKNETVVIKTGDEIRMELSEVLRHAAYRNYFVRFAKEEQSVENILFWGEVEQFTAIDYDVERAEAAREIFERYIAPGSPYELNINQIMIEPVRNVIEGDSRYITPILFKKIRKAVEVNMVDIFERFRSSRMYRELLDSIVYDIDALGTGDSTDLSGERTEQSKRSRHSPRNNDADEDTYWDGLSDDEDVDMLQDEDMAGWMSFVQHGDLPKRSSKQSGSKGSSSGGTDGLRSGSGSTSTRRSISTSDSTKHQSPSSPASTPLKRGKSRNGNRSMHRMFQASFSSQNESVIDWTPQMLREQRRQSSYRRIHTNTP